MAARSRTASASCGEVTRAVAEWSGPERTAVRLSPNGDSQGANDSDPHGLFPAAAAMLSEIGIAFLELREPPHDGTFGKAEVDPVAPAIRKAFAGPLMLNSDYDAGARRRRRSRRAKRTRSASAARSSPIRICRSASPAAADLAPDDQALWYTPGSEGYIDYPAARGLRRARQHHI